MLMSSRLAKFLGGLVLVACLALMVHREASAQLRYFQPPGGRLFGMPLQPNVPAIKNANVPLYPNALFFGTTFQNAGGNNNGNNNGNNQGNNQGNNNGLGGNNGGNNGGGNNGGGLGGGLGGGGQAGLG